MGIREAWNGLIGRQTIVKETVMVHDSDNRSGNVQTGYGRTKYGNIRYQPAGEADYAQGRENGRGVHNDSLIARGIVTRIKDNMINSGMTLESTPDWRMIPETKDWSDEQKREWTDIVEGFWKLYAKSTEADTRGRSTFNQLQRIVEGLKVVEGEAFSVCRYKNGADRTNPLALQLLNNDQIQTPYDGPTVAAIEARGSKIEEGVEYDSNGEMAAIHVRKDLESWDSKDIVRIPVRAPKSKRRWVIHYANFESPICFGVPQSWPRLFMNWTG